MTDFNIRCGFPVLADDDGDVEEEDEEGDETDYNYPDSNYMVSCMAVAFLSNSLKDRRCQPTTCSLFL